MFLDAANRRIIPRWRDFWTAIALGELSQNQRSLADRSTRQANVPSEAKKAWLENRALWHALDFASAAFVRGELEDPELPAAARKILDHPDVSPMAAQRLARSILSPSGEALEVADPIEERVEDIRKRIRLQRQRLHVDPRNAIGWIDLALLYTINGSLRKAEHAVEIAYKLNPNNRFILRSASRFFAHIGDFGRSLKILRDSEALATDPWLIAAEIGLASLAETDPDTPRLGRRLLENLSLPEFSTTELASALGTMELLEGRPKKAKKLFRASLGKPTENSLAQAEWASKQVGELGVEPVKIVVPRNYEVSALHGQAFGNWEIALDNALKWWRDQPFSSRPAVVASYLWSTVFEEDEKSIEIIKASLLSNPQDRVLTNNLAFALINVGKTGEAEETLRAVDPTAEDDTSSITLLATHGLLNFKKGAHARGRALYLEAIDRARLLREERLETMATLYLAREEWFANLPTKAETLKRATKLAEKSAEPDVRLILDRVLTLAKVASRR